MVYIDKSAHYSRPNIPGDTLESSAFGFRSTETTALVNIVHHFYYLT